jgi:hypothetical protein
MKSFCCRPNALPDRLESSATWLSIPFTGLKLALIAIASFRTWHLNSCSIACIVLADFAQVGNALR